MSKEEYFKEWLKVIDENILLNVVNQINSLYKIKKCEPSYHDIFKVFHITPYNDLSIVFLLQDPYPQIGVSTGIADIEFSTHEECQKAIEILDNADISGEKIRVKYAANSFGRFSRRARSAGTQRRNLRRLNRSNRRGIRNRTRRIGRRTRMGASGRKSYRPKTRYFARTLGRRRRQEKKQN